MSTEAVSPYTRKPLDPDEGETGGAWMRWLRANPHGITFPAAPCVRCGTLTTERAIVGFQPVGDDINRHIERLAWCAGCETKRNRAQDAAVAANPAVLPRLRAEAEARLAVA